jgi:8-oxo-dGTP diphosphatase
MKASKEATRTPILAAGGIVLRPGGKPTIAVVQLRKMNAWVLPKGKLAAGESALAAARREVLEETGHRVSIHEFLGMLAYETGGRQKIVRFWRMQALGGPVGELMRDVKAVEWLTIDAAIARLTHVREKVFLEQVGPDALRLARKSAVRRPRVKPEPLPFPQPMPELVAPVDFVAPLPADDRAHAASAPPDEHVIDLAADVSNPTEKDLLEQDLLEKNLIEKTWDWLRHTPWQPKPARD